MMIPLKQWAIQSRPDIDPRSAHMCALRLAKSGRLPEAEIVDMSALRRCYMIDEKTPWPHGKRGPRDVIVCPRCGGIFRKSEKKPNVKEPADTEVV